MKEFENSDLTIKGKIYGFAPVQAEGTINGYPFYFRARHDQWTFSISENPEVSPVDIELPETGKNYGYFAEGHLGKDWEHQASYMDIDKVEDIIIKCSKEYLTTRE